MITTFTKTPLTTLCSSLWLPLLILNTLARAQETTTVVVTVTPTAPHPASYTSPAVFEDTVLSTSNTYRRAHNASHLIWNETLAAYAQNWVQGCQWQHSHGPHGENLAFGYANASTAVEAWGDEGRKYNYQLPTGFTEATGHFTQLVWRATTEVGCAAFDCGYDNNGTGSNGVFTKAQGWYVVCEYEPPGNVMGGNNLWFRINVQSTSTYSGPETTVSSGQTATGTAPRPGATNGAGGLSDMRVHSWHIFVVLITIFWMV